MKTDFIDMDVTDIIMEKPYGFTVNGCRFYLYPVTLGKSYLLSRLITALDLDEKSMAVDPFNAILRISGDKSKELSRILALHTFNTKDEIFNEDLVQERTEFFMSNMEPNDRALLFAMTLTRDDMGAIIKHLGIEAERKRQLRALAAKKSDSNTFTFGGKSILGSMIVPACEKLNLTPQQVVWGISYQYLHLLLADGISQIYLTDEEVKRARISNEPVISGDDPSIKDKIKSQKWD